MGRRWGKTTLGSVLVLNVLRQGGRVAWIAPTYKNTRSPWRTAKLFARPLIASGHWRISESERVITSDQGFLALYSADNIEAILGEAFHLVVIDEAPRVNETVWTESVMPTLADYDGEAFLIGTPKGRNWFYREWQLGLSEDHPEIASWQAPSTDNPNPLIRRAAERARMRISERSYRQEWLAQFIEEGGGVFGEIRTCIGPLTRSKAESEVVFGVDWGKRGDYTVVIVMEADSKKVVELHRWRSSDYRVQVARISEIAQRWDPTVIVAERNSIGDPIIENMIYDYGLPVNAFVTTQKSKMQIIDRLTLAFARRTITIPAEAWLLNELESFEEQRVSYLGLPSYGAPAGVHDDGVMALAFAYHGAIWAGGEPDETGAEDPDDHLN